ncbi:hypothetical protein CNMCM5793_005685 [Aspergillus hiratsukae]|uniref:Single-strand DNA deaminase toxin A-like C-terminal domain-containing protein n=1 Tax=Aspergillus hiratsukae TaxID=1194566 RepID=A0A8H6PH55_9EURO|nr:hypothetical protein CNMCM5793_005685 [Aspergillus hiratsukae]KAF7173012.1 hypothetical protein CNMCM6106_007164 [Aspergillus hiratsukae]
MKNFPEADVIWWDADSYYIRCPFCEGVHRHGINWNTDKLRYSHCEKMESYLCCFPMNDQGEVAYEIDKRRGRYVNICASQDSDTEDDEDEDDVDRLAIELARKATVAASREEMHVNIHEDSKEVVAIDPGNGIEPFEQKRILIAISDCVNGDTSAVQKYLETSSEAQLFVRGRESDGKTTLICAAAGPSSEMVLLLIKHGAELNAVDNYGRSPLMEAALFGWVDNVKILLQQGADKNTRDGENRQAIDLARDHYKNRRERYKRAGGDFTSNRRPDYIEDTVRRDIDRQEIVRLLGGENRKSKIVFGSPPTISLSRSYSFTPSPMRKSLVLHGPIEEYPITRSWKTVARLERGGKFRSVGAMSGWSHCSMQSLRVDGRQWTDDIFYISELTGHLLPPHSCDQGKDGRYNACHEEKQLIAYFIDRHVFLPRDKLADSEMEGKIEWAEDELQTFLSDTGIGREVASLRKRKKDLDHELFDGDEKLVGKHDEIKALELELESVETALNQLMATPQARPFLMLESRVKILNQRLDRHSDLINMANAPPPASLAEAVILISSPPCQDCIMFKDKVNKFFGLSIQLFAAL